METKVLTVSEIESSYAILLKLNRLKPRSDAARYKFSRNLTFFELELKSITETKKGIREDCKVTVSRQPGVAGGVGVLYQASPDGWDKVKPENNGPELIQKANDLIAECFEREEDFGKSEQEIIKFRELNYPKDFPKETTGEDMHRLWWLITEKSLVEFEKFLDEQDQRSR